MNAHRHLLNASALAVIALLVAGCDKPSTESTPATPTAAASSTTAPAASAAPAAAPQAQGDPYEAASKGVGFTTGPVMAANTVYVFFDPTCPHCAALWNNARALQTKLKIVWMPIGLLRSSSGPMGATILSSKDPVAAMSENETSVLAHGSGITVPQNLSEDVLNKVKANTEIFKTLGAESVPLIVYRNSKSGQTGKHDGAVSAEDLSAMVGL